MKLYRKITNKMTNPEKGVLFILGSGASVDSGLFTYRGDNSIPTKIVSIYDTLDEMWNKLNPIVNLSNIARKNEMSDTYRIIQEIIKAKPRSVIFTQNIDGLALSVLNSDEIENNTRDQFSRERIVELHGNISTMRCQSCNIIYQTNENHICTSCSNICRPNIILYFEELKRKDIQKALFLSKSGYSHVLVIGTTLEFPYLRMLINKAKSRGAKVIHVNTNENYNKVEIINSSVSYSTTQETKRKKICNVTRNEIFIQDTAAFGLRKFISEYLNV